VEVLTTAQKVARNRNLSRERSSEFLCSGNNFGYARAKHSAKPVPQTFRNINLFCQSDESFENECQLVAVATPFLKRDGITRDFLFWLSGISWGSN
jgi:hypothetical protein